MSTPTPTPGGAPASDPPPYAWLDDPAQPFGPVGIGTTVVVGSVLGAIGLFGLAYGLFGGDDARGARLGVGIAFVLIGAVIVRMGTARRAWRRRNPGVDPRTAAVESGANVGSAFGDDSRVGRFGRWLLNRWRWWRRQRRWLRQHQRRLRLGGMADRRLDVFPDDRPRLDRADHLVQRAEPALPRLHEGAEFLVDGHHGLDLRALLGVEGA